MIEVYGGMLGLLEFILGGVCFCIILLCDEVDEKCELKKIELESVVL